MQRHTTHGHVSRTVRVLAAMAIIELVLSGDELLTKNHRADAEIVLRPNK